MKMSACSIAESGGRTQRRELREVQFSKTGAVLHRAVLRQRCRGTGWYCRSRNCCRSCDCCSCCCRLRPRMQRTFSFDQLSKPPFKFDANIVDNIGLTKTIAAAPMHAATSHHSAVSPVRTTSAPAMASDEVQIREQSMIPPGRRICGLAIACLYRRRNDEGLQSACIRVQLVKLFTSAP